MRLQVIEVPELPQMGVDGEVQTNFKGPTGIVEIGTFNPVVNLEPLSEPTARSGTHQYAQILDVNFVCARGLL